MSNHCTLDLNCNLFYIYVAFIMSIFKYWHAAEVGGGVGVGDRPAPKILTIKEKKDNTHYCKSGYLRGGGGGYLYTVSLKSRKLPHAYGKINKIKLEGGKSRIRVSNTHVYCLTIKVEIIYMYIKNICELSSFPTIFNTEHCPQPKVHGLGS